MGADDTEPTAKDVLEFWLGDAAEDAQRLMVKARRWFMGGPELDSEIASRFGSLVEAALAGDLDDWPRDIEGRLALIVLLDQFTRNVFRGNPRTYSGDVRARELTLEALDQGLDKQLSLEQRLFLTMPLRHAEDVTLQARALDYAKQMEQEARPELRSFFAMAVEQGNKYHEIIHRFGRFPHRNVILGRPSTREEEAFLVDWAERAAPADMRQA